MGFRARCQFSGRLGFQGDSDMGHFRRDVHRADVAVFRLLYVQAVVFYLPSFLLSSALVHCANFPSPRP